MTRYLPLLMLVLFAGCATKTPKVKVNPLELQSIQMREYEESKDIVFRSIVSVFQDVGYTITYADVKTGLINGESASEGDYSFWTGNTEVSQTKATAFVETIGKITKARLSFVDTTSKESMYGQSLRDDIPIIDAKIYESAFNKIENEIFIRASAQ